ncbi:hypothetical protein ABTX35_26230, partial [Streptomyces sp. NPDC096080]|uniref:hypothetical protein n=1 Tax=Streptomyces sp. NPDC096080 TaxID=3156693 RepID=UPI0033246822
GSAPIAGGWVISGVSRVSGHHAVARRGRHRAADRRPRPADPHQAPVRALTRKIPLHARGVRTGSPGTGAPRAFRATLVHGPREARETMGATSPDRSA